MKYETTQNISLPKIGFGTWSFGGDETPNRKIDSASVAALRSALEVGYTHFDTAEFYASGHTEELVGQAIRESGIGREKLFITSKVWPSHLGYDNVLKSCENSLRRLDMEYVDLYLIHWPQAGMKLEETFRALNKLVRDGKVKHLGVSNFDVKLIKQSQSVSDVPIVNVQVPYSLFDRTYVKNGVLEYCQNNDILLTAYSPIKFQGTRVGKVMQEIANVHSATPFQIALAWLTSQPRVITIPMSFNPAHIKENFEAAEIPLSAEEMDRLGSSIK